MPPLPIIFRQLIAAIDRPAFERRAAQIRAEAYDKSFGAWDHLLALIFAQLSGATSLRELELNWNALRPHHAALGSGPLARSTLSDANQRRPASLFADTFTALAAALGRRLRRDGAHLLQVLDATPIPLGAHQPWARWNGRIRGLKLHVVYDPDSRQAGVLGITDATVNDAEVGRTIPLQAGRTYVFDKGYCHYGWWHAIAAAGAWFVTRPKTNMRLAVLRLRPLASREGEEGDGFTVLEDAEVRLASKGDSSLPIPLRRIRLRRHADGTTLEVLTNHADASAVEIATLYKRRWQIELLFRWLKQHLRIRRFLDHSPAAIRLQLYAALIAYALVHLAARRSRFAGSMLRFLRLIRQSLAEPHDLMQIDPPPRHRRRTRWPAQLAFDF
ncbi:transposase [Methylobacterium sp. Leaf456]|uniref:IS4 family transposase n=1 Tax=Methylobacterium sp. Leaf456 TaxID=1736382 RepID=UPI000700F46A|nr:IS4 family transposase [Methylobacterium sp. Leaf456]KQT49999.1 transposase [Methylobacterium sp. Leaf456]